MYLFNMAIAGQRTSHGYGSVAQQWACKLAEHAMSLQNPLPLSQTVFAPVIALTT